MTKIYLQPNFVHNADGSWSLKLADGSSSYLTFASPLPGSPLKGEDVGTADEIISYGLGIDGTGTYYDEDDGPAPGESAVINVQDGAPVVELTSVIDDS